MSLVHPKQLEWFITTDVCWYNNGISRKIINLLNDTTNQSFKFRTRNCVEINDESKGRYDNSNIIFKTSIIRSNLCDYSNACILVKGTITVLNTAAAGAVVNNTNKKVIFKNWAPFGDCITEINNTQLDHRSWLSVDPKHFK